VTAPDDAYDRGHAAGGIAERLAGHDRHFAAINGSLADLVREMHNLTLAVQHLADQAEANARTVVTTAAALRDAEQARRDTDERRWTPFQRLFAVVAAVAAAVGIYFALVHR
jgi:hypothetical protein